MECLASLGDCGVSHRRDRNRLYRRPQRVFVLAVLAKKIEVKLWYRHQAALPPLVRQGMNSGPLAWGCVFNPFTHAVRTGPFRALRRGRLDVIRSRLRVHDPVHG
jgi:hypothetical protein